VIVETSINDAIGVLRRLLARDCEQQTDFQGWPVEKLTFGQLKKIVCGNESLPDDAPVTVLMDDGMGYGATNGSCTSAYATEDEFQVWF
jgi:hypothetical protein